MFSSILKNYILCCFKWISCITSSPPVAANTPYSVKNRHFDEVGFGTIFPVIISHVALNGCRRMFVTWPTEDFQSIRSCVDPTSTGLTFKSSLECDMSKCVQSPVQQQKGCYLFIVSFWVLAGRSCVYVRVCVLSVCQLNKSNKVCFHTADNLKHFFLI